MIKRWTIRCSSCWGENSGPCHNAIVIDVRNDDELEGKLLDAGWLNTEFGWICPSAASRFLDFKERTKDIVGGAGLEGVATVANVKKRES